MSPVGSVYSVCHHVLCGVSILCLSSSPLWVSILCLSSCPLWWQPSLWASACPSCWAYVYGVVPISLCRSGGCGVSTGNGKGVRIEFDDENQMTVGNGAQTTDTTSVADTRNNPSIGGGSVGGMTGSLSASGSHVDQMGTMRDNLSENASTTALAGASITGSLSGSTMGNFLNRSVL
eukprot:XP_014006062.1 PREDICTED: E3 ubiquitin-protein ligase RNF19A-like isoform X1 [Salmo salar]